MSKLQYLRIFSIAGSLSIGLWWPIRLIGYKPTFWLEVGFDLMVSLISVANIYLFFKHPDRDYKNKRDWLNVGLFFDVLCVLPISLVVFLADGETLTWMLVLNLLCARHIHQIKPFLDGFDNLKPITYRLVPLALSMPLLVHLLACGWIALGSGTAGPDPDPILQYVKALYWTFTTITTVGYGDISAKTIPQMLYCSGAQVLGVGVFGFIISNVASLLSRSDAAREHHMDNLDKIETFMNLHHIPTQLRTKTRAYYHYLWENKKGYQDDSLLEDLPQKLQSELFFCINSKIIEKVPFLQGASQEMLEDLMNELKPRIFVPGEKVFKIDEPGDALYFIQSGQVEIIIRDGTSIARLNEGAFFGEMALIEDRCRSATARATSFCDVYVLHREAFEKVTTAYPEFKEHIQKVVAQRIRAA